MQNTIILTEAQSRFIKIAHNLSFAVIDYSIRDSDFKDCYGMSKLKHKKEIDNLYKKVNKLKY